MNLRIFSDRVQVSALVLGSVTRVAECLLAARVLAEVRLLARVAPQVDLQVLQTGKRFVTALKLWEEERPLTKRKQGETNQSMCLSDSEISNSSLLLILELLIRIVFILQDIVTD